MSIKRILHVEDALALLESETFHLIMLDFTLPDGCGQTLLEHLKTLIEPPAVIVLSGHNLVKDIPGVDRALTKERYQIKDLTGYVKDVVDKT